MRKQSFWVLCSLGLGFAFLYVPIAVLVFFSFNASRLVSVWGGFSTKWYVSLLNDDLVLNAAFLSLRIAAISATVATVLGAFAGIAMARFGGFKGRLMFSGMITAPLVMPEVITGLSLLLLFITLEQLIGWPAGRGGVTVTIAHITFSMAYVAIIVQSRLAGTDESLEEAAMDLGAHPHRVLWDITLPLLTPALAAGWLLAFTLSLDDLVIATFTSGPGASTLPMVVFSKVRLGVTPDMNALASVLIGVVAIGVVVAGLLMYRQSVKRTRDVQLAAARNS